MIASKPEISLLRSASTCDTSFSGVTSGLMMASDIEPFDLLLLEDASTTVLLSESCSLDGDTYVLICRLRDPKIVSASFGQKRGDE